MSKREFWIQEGTPDCVCNAKEEMLDCLANNPYRSAPVYHVIEYSALTDLQKRFENADEHARNKSHQCGQQQAEIDYLKRQNDSLQKRFDELEKAVQYYFDVLDEVRGPKWSEHPDHVLQKLLSAMGRASLKGDGE